MKKLRVFIAAIFVVFGVCFLASCESTLAPHEHEMVHVEELAPTCEEKGHVAL